MNVSASCGASALSLTATIDGISNLALGSAASPPAYFLKTPEPKGINGYKEDFSPASIVATPVAGIENDNDWVYKELAPAITANPKLLLKASLRTERQIRKWKLKAHTAAKGQKAVASYKLNPLKLNPKPRITSTFLALPSTPRARQAAPNPPMLPKRNSIAVKPLSPPDLKGIELLTPSLKPRPTALFLSPLKRRRMSDNDDA